MSINLTGPDVVDFVQCDNFVYREKIGPFMTNAPKAWGEFYETSHSWLTPENRKMMLAANLIDETKEGDEKYIYRAGVVVHTPPESLPEILTVGRLNRGKYAKFVLTGPYSQLPQAFPAAISSVASAGLTLRQEYAFEVYLNTPNTVTDESELLTEIYLPVN